MTERRGADVARWRARDGGVLVRLLRMLLQVGYFDLAVEGAEHLPRRGPVVYVANHAGWFPLDAFFTGMAVAEAAGPERTPVFAAHDLALAAPLLGPFLRRAGAIPASWLRRPERLPPEVTACGIFPEGVDGNTKPFWDAYRMRPWKRGFVRVAAALRAPVVPVAVMGGEESVPVAWTVRGLERVLGTKLALPATPLPLPARWAIIFHRPVRLAPGRDGLHDAEYGAQLAAAVQATVQATLDRLSADRVLGRLSARVASMARRAPGLAALGGAAGTRE